MQLRLIVPSVALLVMAGCSAASADPVIARHLEEFFEAYLDRDLTGSQVREITDEFIRLSQQEGKSRQEMRHRAGGFDVHTRVLRGGQTGPAQEFARDQVIRANFFRPIMQNTLELRLMLEPDPVRVVHRRSQRIMTEKDVVALVNIYRFVQSKKEPEHQRLSSEEVDRAAVELNRVVGAAGVEMPQFYTEASAFWSGVLTQWPKLSAEEKDLVRQYAVKTWRVKLPASLFARVWGLDDRSAFSRSLQDRNERAFAISRLQMESAYMPELIQRFSK